MSATSSPSPWASSGAVLHGAGLTAALALRLGAVALVSAVFTVFVAEYAQLRAGLVRAEHELNLLRSGRMATTQLGRSAPLLRDLACVIWRR